MTLLGKRIPGADRRWINALALTRLVESRSLRSGRALSNQPRRGSSHSLDERRTEVRVPTNDPARVMQWREGRARSLDATVLDVSRSGMRLHVPTQFTPGDTVQILTSTQVFKGEVRHCRPCFDAFVIGIHLSDAPAGN